MYNCFICGQPITDSKTRLRRKVKTGEWIRRQYPKQSVGAIQSHYAMRVVCKFCAKAIDQANVRREFLANLQLIVALTTLFLLILFKHFS